MIVGDTYTVDELQDDGTFKIVKYEVCKVRVDDGSTIVISKQI